MTATTPLDAQFGPSLTPVWAGHSPVRGADRNAGLDLLRVMACLLVVAFHLVTVTHVDFGPLNQVIRGGDTGVYVFFALSGYLLYRPFLRRGVDLRAYAVKRAARIIPGYFVALVGLAVLTGSAMPVEHPLPYLSMTAPYNVELRAFLGNAWTISAEILFYALLPLIARFVDGAVIPRLAIIALTSVVASVIYQSVYGPGIEWLFGAFPFVLWAFVPGMLLAAVEVRDPSTFRRLGTAWFGAIGVVLVTIQALIHFPVPIGSGLGTVLLIAWLAHVRVPFARALTFAGGASYAMYLWHKDLFVAFGPLGLVVALVGAAASWALVERPVLDRANESVARRRLKAGDNVPVQVPVVSP